MRTTAANGVPRALNGYGIVFSCPITHKPVILRACDFFEPTRRFQPPHKAVILRGCNLLFAQMMAVGAERLPALATVLSLQPPSPVCHPDRRGGICGAPLGRPTFTVRRHSLFCHPEPVTFSFFPCISHTQAAVFNPPQQNRHPACPGEPWERSALQICRITKRLQREVEGPRRCLSAHAVRSFRATWR